MAGMRLGEARLFVDSFDAHLSHKGFHVNSAYGIASHSEHVSHAPGAEIRFFQVDFVDETHEFPVRVVYRG